MSEVTRILDAIERGNPHAADELLPLVYDELRQLARSRLAKERGDATLQATALVHEAYMRLIRGSNVEWNGAKHFFGAAAEAMRRIMIDKARRRRSVKHGGGRQRLELDSRIIGEVDDERLVLLDEALDALTEYDERKAEVVKLRFFAGLTNAEVAEALSISAATANRDWTFAKAWLHRVIDKVKNA